MQRHVAALLAVLEDRKINRLQEQTLLVGHDGRDHVHQLRQVRHLHHVRMAEEGVEEHPHGQSVLEIVSLLEMFVIPGAIPDIPFVIGDVNRPGIRSGLRGLNRACGGFDVVVDSLRPAQELLQIVVAVVDVGVQRDIVDFVTQSVQHGAIPSDPVRAVITRSAGHQLDRFIHQSHGLRGLERELGVIFGVLVPQLPPAVDLVTEPPIFHLVRVVTPVLAALVGPISVARFVGVLHPVPRVVDGTQAAVDADVGLRADAFGIAQKFVGAKTIALECVPG